MIGLVLLDLGITCDDLGGPNSHAVYADPSDCTKYFYCFGGTQHKTCAAGQIFDPTQISYTWAEKSAAPCVADGMYAGCL